MIHHAFIVESVPKHPGKSSHDEPLLLLPEFCEWFTHYPKFVNSLELSKEYPSQFVPSIQSSHAQSKGEPISTSTLYLKVTCTE